jgi:hypothetical protein
MEELSVKTFNDILRESKKYKIGTCVEVGENDDLPWSDATELAQDLENNFVEISSKEFADNCDYLLPKHHYTFLKSSDDDIYIALDLDKDIHHFFR